MGMPADTIRNYLIGQAAAKIKADPVALHNLISFETAGTFDPAIKNPSSTARGLIQFTNATAQSLGYADSADLVAKNPTFADQLAGPVVSYLSRFMPYETRQELYMAVFYPAAKDWPLNQPFPEWVRRANPGINFVGDYVSLVEGRPKYYYWGIPILAAIVGYLIYKKRKGE